MSETFTKAVVELIRERRDLRAQLSAAQARIAYLESAFAISGLDISPCKICGKPVICIPDGLPCCDPCAEKESPPPDPKGRG